MRSRNACIHVLALLTFFVSAAVGNAQAASGHGRPVRFDAAAVSEVARVPLPPAWPRIREALPGIIRVLDDSSMVAVDWIHRAAWILHSGAAEWEVVPTPRGFEVAGVVVDTTGRPLLISTSLALAGLQRDALSGASGLTYPGPPADGRIEGESRRPILLVREAARNGATYLNLIRLRTGGKPDILFSDKATDGHTASFPTCGLSDVLVRPVLSPRVAWSLSPDSHYAVAGNTHRAAVVHVDLTRGRAHEVQLPLSSVAVDMDSAARSLLGEGWRLGDCVVPVEEAVGGRGTAPSPPQYTRLAVDREGRVWVERPADDMVGPIEVFDMSGNLVTKLDGIAFPVAFANDGFVAWPSKDPGYLIKYRVRQ